MIYKAKQDHFEKDKFFINEKIKLPVTIGKTYHFIYEPHKWWFVGWENAKVYLYGDNGVEMFKLSDEETVKNFFSAFEPVIK